MATLDEMGSTAKPSGAQRSAAIYRAGAWRNRFYSVSDTVAKQMTMRVFASAAEKLGE